MLQYITIALRGRTSRMSERGASAVEYGLLVALIAAIIVVAVAALGGTVNGAFEDTNEGITPAA